MNVVIDSAAYADVDDLSESYEGQESGVGTYFVQQFLSTARGLKQTEGIHSKIRNFYRCKVDRFPVAIFTSLKQQGCEFMR